MNIVVCIKQVPDVDDIKWTKENNLDRSAMLSKINPQDEMALDWAMHIKTKFKDVKVSAISMGPIQAKEILNLVWGTEKSAEEETKRLNYIIDMSDDLVQDLLNAIFEKFATAVEQYKEKQDPKILNFLVGQVMREAKGKANAGEVMEKIKSKLN